MRSRSSSHWRLSDPRGAAWLSSLCAVALAMVVILTVAGSAFAEESPPAVSAVDPAWGSTTGAETVTITGTNFTGATSVTFGGTDAAGFSVDLDTQITATTPAHVAGTVQVQVTTPAGASEDTTADDFIFGPNYVHTTFESYRHYDTDADSVSNTSLDGYKGVGTDIHNSDDESDASFVGTGAEGGPVLDLTTSGATTSVQESYLTSGAVPGTAFTWDIPAMAENEGQGGYYADLEGTVSFAPGFATSRSADQTVFDFIGDTQVLTITVTPGESIERLSINGGVPDNPGYCTATIQSVTWDTEPPSCDMDYDGGSFWGAINDAESGTTYTLYVTTDVASTIDGLDVTFMPHVNVRNEDTTAESTEPEIGSGLTRALTDATWTWTADGTYLWNWREMDLREVQLKGYADADANQVHATFDTESRYHTDGDSVLNTTVDGWTQLNANLHNFGDSTGEAVTGTSGEGGPVLDLASASTVTEPMWDYLTSGSVPGTSFTWGFPALPEDNGQGAWVKLEGSSSFEPGFAATRSADQTVFDSTGGTQELTLTMTAKEATERLSFNGNVHPGGGDYTSSLVSVEWVGTAPASYDLDYNTDNFWGGINSPEVDTTYTLLMTTDVASTVGGVNVTFMPDIGIRNEQNVAYSSSPEVGSSLARVMADTSTFTWTADGSYLWNWNESASRVVYFNGWAFGDANYVNANFGTYHRYHTDDDSVANTTLDGYVSLNCNVGNSDDGTDAPLVGTSGEDGPILELATTGATSDVRWDYLTSGAPPGTAFTWGFPALGENEGQNGWANLEGTSSFTPGFAVSRSADQTVFDFAGGTQVLTLTVTPEEAIEGLQLNGGVPGGSGCCDATIQSVTWDATPPDSSLDHDGNSFWASIQNAESGVTYTLYVTTNVASTIEGVDVDFMPDIDICNEQTVDWSTGPESGDTLEHVLTYGTFTWTADGTYLWEWAEQEGRTVHLNGRADADANFVNAHFDTSQQYDTDADSVANTTLDGYLNTSADMGNDDDGTDSPVVGPGAPGGPVLELSASGPTMGIKEDYLTSGAVPGTEFTWSFPALGENEGTGSGAALEGTESFQPGFAVSRSADQTVFDFTGGTQVLTLTMTPEENLDCLSFNGSIWFGGYGYYDASIQSVAWDTEPPDFWLDQDEGNFWGGINNAESGTTYTLYVTTEVASTLDGVSVTFMPSIQVRNEHTVDWSEGPEAASGLVCETAAGTWTWTVDGTYLWNWNETESRMVCLNGYAFGDANEVWADFSTSQRYHTDGDTVTNTSLEGWTQLDANLQNQEDGTGEAVVGTSAEGGPVLDLASASTIVDLRWDYLTSGSVPGTAFTWDFPAVLQNSGENAWAALEGTASFTPGFDVARSADYTTFSDAGGTQELTLTITPREAMERLNINGNVQPGGYEYYTTNLVSVEWVGDAPPECDLDHNERDFWGGINNPEVDVTYTLLITTEVASTLAGVDVTFMPDIDLSNNHTVADAVGPEASDSLAHEMADTSTFTWTADGTYLWNWHESANKIVHLNGYANGDANLIWADFSTSQRYHTDGDTVTNTSLEGWTQLDANLYNQEDGTGESVVGTSAEGGPVLDLASASTIADVRWDYLTSGSVPGTAFTWDFPAVLQNNGENAWAALEGTASFAPGFDVSRSADYTTFSDAGGTQELTLTITPREAMGHLYFSGNVRPGGFEYYTTNLVSVEWVSDPPPRYDLDHNESDIWCSIYDPEVDTAYTLLITTEVASTLPGVNVTFMPDIEAANLDTVAESAGPEIGSSLAHEMTDTSTFTWTADGTYVWNWNETANKVVHLNGYANGDANLVHASVGTSQRYDTEDDSVANVTLDGYLQLNLDLYNQGDSSGEPILGTSAQGGPVLDLVTVGATSGVSEENLTSGAPPGTEFTWGFPAIAEEEGQGAWATIEGTASFAPGFAVSRSADQTVFDFAGGTQVLTITVTPGEEIPCLVIQGGIPDSEHVIATIQSVIWDTEPPDSYLDYKDGGFGGCINNAQSGVTYTLYVTTQVASTIEGVDVSFVPDVEVHNQETVAQSTSPGSGSRLESVLSDGTWTCTTDGTYLWSWEELESRCVSLRGYAGANANVVWAMFGTTQVHRTQEDSVDNTTLGGVVELGSVLINHDDATDTAVTGSSAAGGPTLDLSTTGTAVLVQEDFLTGGSVPGTAFEWGFPAISENEGRTAWADLEGAISFTPGFSAGRSADQTVFDSSGGTQVLTLTVTPQEAMDTLMLNVDAHPSGSEDYNASIVAANWQGEPPTPPGVFNVNPDDVMVQLFNPEVGSAYTLLVTIEVASTVESADIDYMPLVAVRNVDVVANSTAGESGSSLEHVLTDGTWTWTADGTYLWTWSENAPKVVEFGGHVTPVVTRYEETDPHLLYTGTWEPVVSGSASGGSFARGINTAAQVKITFNGTDLSWVARTGMGFGVASLSLDGGAPELVDLSSAVGKYQQIVWSSGALAGGTHTVVIACAGLTGAYGSSTYINIDALDVAGELITPNRYEEDDPSLFYAGAWFTQSASGASEGAFMRGLNTISQARITFNGTNLSWVARTGPRFGVASLSLDGGAPELVDLSSTINKYQQTVWSSGSLAEGTHTVVITCAGLAGAYGTGTYIDIDALDVVGTLLTPTRYEEDDPSLFYTGAWFSQSTSSGSGGTLVRGINTIAQVTVTFNGTNLCWVARTGPTFGVASLSLDGGAPELVDLSSTINKQQQTVWSSGSLADGTHTVVITCAGLAGAYGTGTYINIDALDVAGELVTPDRYEQDHPGLSYTGAWFTQSASGASGGSLVRGLNATAQVTITFTGTSLSWMARTGTAFGLASLVLDGGDPHFVDLSSSITIEQRMVWSSGPLADETHTVVITYTGLAGAYGTGTYINIDALDVVGTLVEP